MKKYYSHYKKLKAKGDTEWELSKLKHTGIPADAAAPIKSKNE